MRGDYREGETRTKHQRKNAPVNEKKKSSKRGEKKKHA